MPGGEDAGVARATGGEDAGVGRVSGGGWRVAAAGLAAGLPSCVWLRQTEAQLLGVSLRAKGAAAMSTNEGSEEEERHYY